MGVMESFVPEDSADTFVITEDSIAAPAGIDAALLDEASIPAGAAADGDFAPLRRWPRAITELYYAEIVQRIYREEHFLFLLGLLMCLATIGVDVIVNPGMATEGAVLRVLVVAPLTLLGLFAGARGWSRILAFCVGAAPISFIAVIVHLAVHLPPDLAPRYLLATVLVVGLANVILPYSLRGLVIFDLSALLVTAAMLLMEGPETLAAHADMVLIFALVVAATLPVAARFEKLRQRNFLLTLRARIFSRELLKANRALHALSQTDPLTGIANRRGFEEEFETAIRAPGNEGRGSDLIALMMIDLDYFKSFNDAHGHQAGDSCLKLVADALIDNCENAGAIVARYGGEEFVAAMRTRDRDAVMAAAEKMRQSIANVLSPARDSDRPMVTASIGVAIAPASAMLPREELIEMADAALYSGKDGGRNRVEVVEAEMAFGNRP